MWKAFKILVAMVASEVIVLFVAIFMLMEFEGKTHGNSIKAALYLGAYSLAFIAFLAPGIIDWYLRKRGVSKQRPVFRWLSHLTCPSLVVTAIVVAFPRLIGSDDKPAPALAIAFLGLAVVFGISIYAGGSKSRPGKHR